MDSTIQGLGLKDTDPTMEDIGRDRDYPESFPIS